MLKMRIKIDVWSQGLSSSDRKDIREKLGKLFCQLPMRRVWLYLKRVRIMIRTGNGEKAEEAIESCLAGKETEDIIMNGRLSRLYTFESVLTANTGLAKSLIRTGRVGHLMWFAAINELHKAAIVGAAGSICECGTFYRHRTVDRAGG